MFVIDEKYLYALTAMGPVFSLSNDMKTPHNAEEREPTISVSDLRPDDLDPNEWHPVHICTTISFIAGASKYPNQQCTVPKIGRYAIDGKGVLK